jgi:hypothetical protein
MRYVCGWTWPEGQVTVPQEIRNRLGLLPHTKVKFEFTALLSRFSFFASKLIEVGVSLTCLSRSTRFSVSTWRRTSPFEERVHSLHSNFSLAHL